MKVPFRYSSKAVFSSSWVFMTIGPCHATGSHPPDISGSDNPFIPHVVSMLHIAMEHISDGFDSPVRMPGRYGRHSTVAFVNHANSNVEQMTTDKLETTFSIYALNQTRHEDVGTVLNNTAFSLVPHLLDGCVLKHFSATPGERQGSRTSLDI